MTSSIKPQIIKTKDAYRYFFPVGWALGLWGVLLWILFPWNLVSYPGINHPEIMTGGFFLCFVCGFLMTAAPKFTASFEPTPTDEKISYGLIALLILSLFFNQKAYFYAATLFLFIFLIYFLVRRFKNRKSNPPDAFIFVGFGIFSGLASCFILLLSQFVNIPFTIFNLGRLLFFQGYILCLVLGVGSRLIPALLGRALLPNQMSSDRSIKPKIAVFMTLGLIFIFSYMLEALDMFVISQVVRSLVIVFILFKFWKIHLLPLRRVYQSWCLWASACSLLLGQIALIILPAYRIHLLHVILVSGLGLMTFMIATRVTLAHGGHNMKLENSKALLIAGVLISFAGLTRLSASFAAHIYQTHLIYAAYTWIIALLIWGWIFLPKLIATNPEGESHH